MKFKRSELESKSKPELIEILLRGSQKEPGKKKREFDWNQVAFHRIALKFAYFGYSYHGLAIQDSVPTVESHLFEALLKAHLIKSVDSCGFSRCGRTDKGVSSFAQIVSLNVRTNSSSNEISYVTILNALLPPDIRIIAWSAVPDTFDARFDCSFRRYKYFFPCEGLNIKDMDIAAKHFVGETDFSLFCKVDVSKNVKSYVRTIFEASVKEVSHHDLSLDCSQPNKFFVFEVKGSAFLWHQVRCMVAILFLIGRGLERPSLILEMTDPKNIADSPGKPIYKMASEVPLVLVECGYEFKFEWRFGTSPSFSNDAIMRKLFEHLWMIWRDYAIKAEHYKSLLNEFGGFEFLFRKFGIEIPAIVCGESGGLGGRGTSIPFTLSDGTLQSTVGKAYIPIMQRQRADSITEKLSNLESKKRLHSSIVE